MIQPLNSILHVKSIIVKKSALQQKGIIAITQTSKDRCQKKKKNAGTKYTLED